MVGSFKVLVMGRSFEGIVVITREGESHFLSRRFCVSGAVDRHPSCQGRIFVSGLIKGFQDLAPGDSGLTVRCPFISFDAASECYDTQIGAASECYDTLHTLLLRDGSGVDAPRPFLWSAGVNERSAGKSERN